MSETFVLKSKFSRVITRSVDERHLPGKHDVVVDSSSRWLSKSGPETGSLAPSSSRSASPLQKPPVAYLRFAEDYPTGIRSQLELDVRE